MSIKQLAGQTIWYGASNILARFINVLVTPILTYLLSDGQKGQMDMGDFTRVYAWIAVANVLFTYGMETGYFRFINKKGASAQTLFNTASTSLILTTIPLCLILILCTQPIHQFFGLLTDSSWVTLVALIIGLDTLSTIPFARLRQEGRPKKYALVKVSSVIVYLLSIVFFLYIIPVAWKDISNPLFDWLRSQHRVILIIAANVVQNIVVFILLLREWKGFSLSIDLKLWKKILRYSTPMILIGLAGMINEVMDREFIMRLMPGSVEERTAQLGIYGANYKIAIFITLFIQAFRLGAEPFFFKQSGSDNAPATYARVLKWFTITLCIAFLTASLNLNVIILAIHDNFRTGMEIIPVILLANVFLGLYYNLSMWYKITDNMRWGVFITLTGAAVTIAANYLLIPAHGIMGAAYATLICYFSMCVLAYIIGRKYYPVPYELKKIVFYIGISYILYILQDKLLDHLSMMNIYLGSLVSGVIFLLIFLFIVIRVEKINIKSLSMSALQAVKKR